jgi:hypothetical protein
MCEQNVTQSDEPRKPLALEPAKITRERTATSRTQEFNNVNGNEGADPDWPRPVRRGGRVYYVTHEVDAYLERVIERGRDKPVEGMPPQLAAARGYRNGE